MKFSSCGTNSINEMSYSLTKYDLAGPQALPSQKSGNFFPHIAGGVLVASCLVAALVVVGVAKVWIIYVGSCFQSRDY